MLFKNRQKKKKEKEKGSTAKNINRNLTLSNKHATQTKRKFIENQYLKVARR